MAEGAMEAIRNLGELDGIVNPMIQNATSLIDQRKKTYDSLNRLRDMARQFLSTYEGNRVILENLYQTIQTEASRSDSKRRQSLNVLSEILQQAINNPTEEDVRGLIGDVDRLIEQMSPNNVGTLRPPIAGPMPPPDSGSDPDGNVGREGRQIDGQTNPSGSGFLVKGGKRRSIKRGGFVWDKTPGSKRKSMTRRTRSRTRTRRS